jgi:hypothetical protein
MIRGHQEEIQGLLTFVRPYEPLMSDSSHSPMLQQAGLFSAVVTGFIVITWTQLQEDTGDTAAIILRRISIQLEHLSSNNSGPIQPIIPLPPTFSSPPTSITRVNVLWSLSLVLSLVAALFIIMIGQWLQSYIAWVDITPVRRAISIRHQYHRSYTNWGVPTFIGLIPAFLQSSLVLFLSGFVDLAWTLNKTIALVLTVAISLFLGVATLTIFLPIFINGAPYKTSLGWLVYIWSIWILPGILFAAQAVRLINFSPFLFLGSLLSYVDLDKPAKAWIGGYSPRHWRHRDELRYDKEAREHTRSPLARDQPRVLATLLRSTSNSNIRSILVEVLPTQYHANADSSLALTSAVVGLSRRRLHLSLTIPALREITRQGLLRTETDALNLLAQALVTGLAADASTMLMTRGWTIDMQDAALFLDLLMESNCIGPIREHAMLVATSILRNHRHMPPRGLSIASHLLHTSMFADQSRSMSPSPGMS